MEERKTYRHKERSTGKKDMYSDCLVDRQRKVAKKERVIGWYV